MFKYIVLVRFRLKERNFCIKGLKCSSMIGTILKELKELEELQGCQGFPFQFKSNLGQCLHFLSTYFAPNCSGDYGLA